MILANVLIVAMQAAPESPKVPAWYEQITGMIAIPAGLIGLAYSYILIRKTNLEAKKTELEILGMERQLKIVAPVPSVAALVEPIAEARRTQFVFLRFVLLYVVLELWGIVDTAFGNALGGWGIVMQGRGGPGFDLLLFALSNLTQVIRWLIIITVGWPLARDIMRILGVEPRDLVWPWHGKS